MPRKSYYANTEQIELETYQPKFPYVDENWDEFEWNDDDLPELKLSISDLFDSVDHVLCPQCRAEVLPGDFSRSNALDCVVCGYSGPVETFNVK